MLQQFHLQRGMGFVQQARFSLQPLGEFLEVVFIDGPEKLGHDDRLPGTAVCPRMFDQVIDESAPSAPSLHTLSEGAVEFNTTRENEGGDRPMPEPAGLEKSLSHSGGVATGMGPRCGKKIPHAVAVAQCRQNIESARQNTPARKELQYSTGAGANGCFPYRRIRPGPAIQQKH